MNHITITEYKPSYEEEIIRLILTIQKDEFHLPVSIQDQPDLHHIPSVYQKNGNFWVALYQEHPVGTLGLISLNARQAALKKMFVEKDFRGAPFSAASALMDHAAAWASSHHMTDLFLGTADTFRRAHHFYENHHFQQISREELPPHFTAMKIDTRFYHLSLSRTYSKNTGIKA